MSARCAPPELSVALVTPHSFAHLGRVLQALRAQNVRAQIEILIVSPSVETLAFDEEALRVFHSHRVLSVGEIVSLGAVIAHAVREARGEVFVYVEEHSFPRAGWAEALIRAHEKNCVAVGPALACANPNFTTSRAGIILCFAPWLHPARAGEMPTLPPHQTSYKRAALLACGPALPELLETEAALHRHLRARGGTLFFEPAAVTEHVNSTRLSSLVAAEFHGFRAGAAARARSQHWSLLRRLIYIAGSPLIPMLRGWRLLRELRRTGWLRASMLALTGPILLGFVFSALGECTGLLFGPGDAARRRLGIELDRRRHIHESDRALFDT